MLQDYTTNPYNVILNFLAQKHMRLLNNMDFSNQIQEQIFTHLESLSEKCSQDHLKKAAIPVAALIA